MKHLFCFISCLALVGLSSTLGGASPLPTLQLVPSAGTVMTGETVTLNLNIAGLGAPGPMEVGSFDSFIGFDPSMLSPTGATFTSLLGDPALFLSITAFDTGPGFAEAADVSLLSVADLDAMQPSSFTLATYSFTALKSGSISFSYLGGPVDDGFGDLIAGTKTVTPEPSPLLLILSGLAGVSRWRLSSRRRRAVCAVLALWTSLLISSAHAEINVTGDKDGLKTTINSLLKGATVDIDAAGKMTITGNPTNEFGKQLKTIIDGTSKVTIDVKNNATDVTTGSFDGGGKQTIDLADIKNYADPGNMLPTKAANLIHELAEVYDSVKDGKTKAPKDDGGKDYQANHKGSALTAESAVNKDEAGITRTSENTPAGVTREGASITIRAKAEYDKAGTKIYIDDILKATGKNAPKVVKSEVEPAKPKKGGRYITQEEPGIATFSTPFQPVGFLPLDQPGYLAIDLFGNVYVSEQRLNRVLVFDRFLNPQFTISNPRLVHPQGIAVSQATQQIFVGTGDTILVFDLTGSFLSIIGNSLLSSVRGLAIDPNGFLFASSFNNNMILKFDPASATLVGSFTDPRLQGPEGLAADQLGNIWVASFYNDKILSFAPAGSPVTEFVSGGALQGPRGIALAPQSFVLEQLNVGGYGEFHQTLLAASSGNNEVLEYSMDTGDLLGQVALKSPVGVGDYNEEKSICDINGDGTIDRNDINMIFQSRGNPAKLYDARDADGDGVITVNDARVCTLFCTKAQCSL